MALAKFQQNYTPGTGQVAMQAPLTAISGAQIALNGITSGSTASATGCVLGGGNVALGLVEYDSLTAVIETKVTTNTITVTPIFQVSDDGTNWITVLPQNGAAYVQWPATGTGSTVYTQRAVVFQGNPCKKYFRTAVTVGGATGGANDSVIVSYSWRQRQTITV